MRSIFHYINKETRFIFYKQPKTFTVMTLKYVDYIHSEHYDPERYVTAGTNGYERLMRTATLCDEMDDCPYLMDDTTVTF